MEGEQWKLILEKRGYAVWEQIGCGTFSKVYRVADKRTGRTLACKISVHTRMLSREGEVLRRVNHPLFPEYYDLWEQEKWAFLCMEYIQGRTLEKIFSDGSCLTTGQVIQVADCLAEGLSYLHGLPEPFYYRDLKPENIMLEPAGRIKLLDFGSAGPSRFFQKVATGTPGYAAPEQFVPGLEEQTAADVYALGQILRRMLLQGRTGENKKYRGLMRLADDCIRKVPKERVPDMGCFRQRLAACATGRIGGRNGRGWNGDYLIQKNIMK